MIIKDDFNLSKLNTFGVNALARKVAFVTSVNDLTYLYRNGYFAQKPVIISKASNILLTGNMDKLVLMNMIWGKEIIQETDREIILRVSSGEFWPDVVSYSVRNSLGGIENMADIPGKAGAAPVQNIGAYGRELKDVLVSLQAFDLTNGKVVNFSNADCEFGYRNSIFKSKEKGRYFITGIDIKLVRNPEPELSYRPLTESMAGKNKEEITITEVYDKVCEIRAGKLPDPKVTGNAGSFFKNPVVNRDKLSKILETYPDAPYYTQPGDLYKVPAGWLIDKCNLKGTKLGPAGVHNKQALVIVNHGGSTGKDIIALAELVKKNVFEKFGITLEFEVNIW